MAAEWTMDRDLWVKVEGGHYVRMSNVVAIEVEKYQYDYSVKLVIDTGRSWTLASGFDTQAAAAAKLEEFFRGLLRQP